MADAAYGLWPLVILNTGLFVLFAVSFFHPKTERDCWSGDPHLSPFHLASYLQWPTIPTLLMFPVLVVYTRLAKGEEREVAARFGDAWRTYATATPGFVPRRRAPAGYADRHLSRRTR